MDTGGVIVLPTLVSFGANRTLSAVFGYIW